MDSKNILASTLDYPQYEGAAIYSSRFVEDGSFLKLDNLTLSYNLKSSDLFSNCMFYVTGQNLFTLTKYKGVDPEVSITGLAPGVDWYDYYPRTRTYLIGMKISF